MAADNDEPLDTEEPEDEPAPDEPEDEPDPSDEPDPDEPTDDEPEPEPEPAPRARSSRERIQELARRSREAEERERAAIRRAEEAERRAGERSRAESAEERQRRLDVMTPEERTDFLLQEQRQDFQRQMGGLAFQMADRDDRSEFRLLCGDNPAMAAVKDEVERELQAMRANGQNISREKLGYFLIGRRAATGAKAAGTRQRAKGREAIERQTTRTTRSRSDTGSDRGRGGKSAEDRLDGVLI